MGQDPAESLTPPAPAMSMSMAMTPLSSSSLHPRPSPVRDDCWSPEATATLIQAWGQRYVDTKHGNLRQKHWQEVADIVNSRHGHNKKARRTDVQCKNRIDTLKKKYKVEKARVLDSKGTYVSDWPFFPSLDALIGSLAAKKSLTPPSPSMNPPMGVPLSQARRMTPSPVVPLAAMAPQKRPASIALNPPYEGHFRKNYSAMAAEAAAASFAAAEAAADETEDDEDEEDAGDESRSSGEMMGGESDGFRKLATAIERFSEVYARVEGEKQRQMVELEKQRMQFAKEMECQRMQMLVEMQVQLEKVKRAKRSNNSNAQEMIYEAVLPFFLADTFG